MCLVSAALPRPSSLHQHTPRLLLRTLLAHIDALREVEARLRAVDALAAQQEKPHHDLNQDHVAAQTLLRESERCRRSLEVVAVGVEPFCDLDVRGAVHKNAWGAAQYAAMEEAQRATRIHDALACASALRAPHSRVLANARTERMLLRALGVDAITTRDLDMLNLGLVLLLPATMPAYVIEWAFLASKDEDAQASVEPDAAIARLLECPSVCASAGAPAGALGHSYFYATMLIKAAKCGSEASVAALLTCARVRETAGSARDQLGRTALIEACRRKTGARIVSMLLTCEQVRQTAGDCDAHQRTALIEAARYCPASVPGLLACTEVRRTAGDCDAHRRTALIEAARFCSASVPGLLACAEVARTAGSKDSHGNTALHISLQKRHGRAVVALAAHALSALPLVTFLCDTWASGWAWIRAWIRGVARSVASD
jgi:hypothetical protein